MSSKISYRADIDGMRTVAVLLVMLFHANIPYLTGGFIGVDVFFVISGYLITASINKEMLNNSFSFKQFYLRRIRRIIPVLVFIMLMVTIPAYFFFFANDLETYGRTLLHSILSTNNFYLWLNGKDYFVENTDLIPLVHTWSLSVEEQFYVIWPVILLLLHKNFSPRTRLISTLVFVLLGIGLSTYLATFYPLMAYFLLPARLFELLIGGCLALFWNRIPKINSTKNHIFSILGILFILVPAFTLTKLSLFPGYNAFLPCLGTVFLILSGKNRTRIGVINSLLETKPFVFLGLLSYSMYLWHWPIFVFIKYRGLNLTPTLVCFAILSTIVLSYFSWRFVEKPFRYNFKFDFKRTLYYVLLPSLAICALIYGVLDAKNGFPDRFPNLTEFDKKANFPNKVRKNCFDTYKVGNCNDCALGTKKDTLDGVLIGDSFANHSAAFVDVLAKDANLYFHDSAAGGYPLLYNIDNNGNPIKSTTYGDERLAYAKKYKSIIIASNWTLYSKNTKDYDFILSTLKSLIDADKKIIIIDPLRDTNDSNLHKMKLLKAGFDVNFKKSDLLIPFTKRLDNYIVYEMKRRFPSLTVINLNDVMCRNNDCDYAINNSIIYRNSNHLNTSGATLLGKKYIKEKGNPLLFLNGAK